MSILRWNRSYVLLCREYGNWGKYGVEPSRRNGFFPRSEPAPSSFGHHSSGGYNSRSNGGHGQTTNPYSRFREEEEVYTDHYVQSQNNDPSNYLSTGYDFEYGSHVASPQEHHFAQYTQPAPAPHYPPVSGQVRSFAETCDGIRYSIEFSQS